MSPITHGLVGWIIAETLPTRRERVLVTVAAVAPDIDGLSIIFGGDVYGEWHHTFGHNVFFGLAYCVLVFALAKSWRVTVLAALSFHSHLLCDLLGSGEGWKIEYLWPLSKVGFEFAPPFQWELASWQNTLITLICLTWIASIGVKRKRTVVEVLSVKADARIVQALTKRFSRAV